MISSIYEQNKYNAFKEKEKWTWVIESGQINGLFVCTSFQENKWEYDYVLVSSFHIDRSGGIYI